jgi:hypothetical protein
MTTTTAPCSTSDLPIVVVDRRRQRFYMIDNVVLDRYGKELKPTGIAVYNGLARYTNREGTCWPSQTTLANLVGMSRMQVSREIKKLEQLKLISVEHKFGSNGQQCANQYTLLDVPAEDEPVTHRYTPCHHELHPPVTDSDTPRHRQLHEQHPGNKTQTEQNTEEQPVVVALVNQGISERVASKLAKNHSKAHIEEKLDYLAFLMAERPESIQKPCGWLRKAIEEDYAAPDGFLSAEERAAAVIEAQRCEEETRLYLEERERQEVAEQEQQCQNEEARLADLHTAYDTTQQEIDLWKQLLCEFKLNMLAASFSRYVADTVLLSLKDGEALIGLPNPQARDWLETRFATKIRRTLSSCLRGQPVTVKFVDLNPSHEPLSVSQAGTG